jgi:hypothetical protein
LVSHTLNARNASAVRLHVGGKSRKQLVLCLCSFGMALTDMIDHSCFWHAVTGLGLTGQQYCTSTVLCTVRQDIY